MKQHPSPYLKQCTTTIFCSDCTDSRQKVEYWRIKPHILDLWSWVLVFHSKVWQAERIHVHFKTLFMLLSMQVRFCYYISLQSLWVIPDSGHQKCHASDIWITRTYYAAIITGSGYDGSTGKSITAVSLALQVIKNLE